MDNDYELNLCPFCDSAPEIVENENGTYWIKCTGCEAQLGSTENAFENPLYMARLWNGEDRAQFMVAAPDLYKALAFAKSVILSGEPWTDACDEIIDGALKKARGES